MPHTDDTIQPLDPRADLATVVAKINELIDQINDRWHPDDPEP